MPPPEQKQRLHVIIYTLRDDSIPVISLRKARQYYERMDCHSSLA